MATPLKDRYERYYAANRGQWREWLRKHHDKSTGIWLIYHKKNSSKPRVEYNDAVEEALCFGWIDSLMQPIDEDSYMQLFTPRKPKSNWVSSNKERVERLIAQGLMTPAGMAKVEEAKKNGTWDALAHVENLTVPPDLKKAMAAKKKARMFYESLTDGKKKQILFWLNNAKREETRMKRIAAIVKALGDGKMPTA